jgi:hypothetical protein
LVLAVVAVVTDPIRADTSVKISKPFVNPVIEQVQTAGGLNANSLDAV